MTDSKLRILIVDDDEKFLKICTTIFYDYEVDQANKISDAKGLIIEKKPDLILCDVRLNNESGYDLSKWFRINNIHPNTIFLFISAYNNLETRIKSYEAGGNDFISKPVMPTELRAKIKAFLKLKQAEDELLELNSNLEFRVKLRSEQLLHCQKYTAIGKNMVGIIHNINNPLCAILGYSSLLKLDFPNDKRIDMLSDASRRIQDIVSSLLIQKNSGSIKEEEISLSNVLEREIEFIKTNPFAKEIQIIKDLKEIPSIYGIKSHFQLSLGNIICNAVESMYDLPSKILEIHTFYQNGKIIIRVIDSGIGIQNDTINKIFDPFFTTKPSITDEKKPTGTGLGLATSKKMLEDYGGQISINSEVNIGTQVTITIPLPERNS